MPRKKSSLTMKNSTEMSSFKPKKKSPLPRLICQNLPFPPPKVFTTKPLEPSKRSVGYVWALALKLSLPRDTRYRLKIIPLLEGDVAMS